MKRTKIRPVSVKRQAQLDEYKTVRNSFLQMNPDCQGECNSKAVEVHHKRGKSGNQLNETADFMAVCRPCHDYIEAHPAWARSKDFTRSRIGL